MEKKSRKGLVYTICFACIMLIDWTRGSLKWEYWASCINLTGVVMSLVMLSHFSLKKVSLKRYGIWFLLWFFGSGVGYFIWHSNPGTVFLSQYITASISVACLGIVALQLWQERKVLQSANLGNPFLVAIWVILSVLMLFSRLSELWPIWYLIMFGMFYLIPFTKDEKKSLWDGVANGIILGFFLLQIFAYGFRPYDEIRYKGAYGNCNINAMMYLAAFIMTLYKIHSLCWEKNKKIRRQGLWLTFYLVLSAGLFSFILFTMTRTALMVAVGSLIIFGILEAWVLHKMKWWKILLRGAAFGICIVLTFPCVYLTVRYLPTILNHPIWWEGEYHVQRVHSYDPDNSEKYVSWDEVMQTMLGRWYTQLSLQDNSMEQKESPILLASSKPFWGKSIVVTLASITADAEALMTEEEKVLLTGDDSGNSLKVRLEIYKRYINHLNLTGHTQEEGYFPITASYHAWHAQNVFLQIAFYHGIPAGICFTILMLGLGIGAVRLVFRRKSKEDLLPLLVGIFFIGYGMMECVWYLGQSVLFLMYLMPKVLIDECRKETE